MRMSELKKQVWLYNARLLLTERNRGSQFEPCDRLRDQCIYSSSVERGPPGRKDLFTTPSENQIKL
jgi:hypothetical protein